MLLYYNKNTDGFIKHAQLHISFNNTFIRIYLFFKSFSIKMYSE